MTEKLYYENAYIREFEAQVLRCEPMEGGFGVVLNKTAFFPEGGGQPSDEGTLGGAKMLRADEKGDEIVHLCDRALVPGETVQGCLDFERRFLHMQLHSGEHILSGFLHQLTGFDNVGFHMGETAITVDFNGAVTEETLAEAERLTNEKIWENVEINELYPSDEELGSISYRSKKELTGQVRLVEIPGADLCACCGTHVKRTGEVGLVKVLFCQNYKGGVRITMQAGKRAFEDYCRINSFIRAAGALLKSPPEEVPGAVEKLLGRLDEMKGESVQLKRKLRAAAAEGVEPGGESCCFVIEGDANDAREFCDLLCDRAAVAAVFAGSESGVKYCVGSRTQDVRPIGKKLNEALSGRGGGRPEMVQGSISVSAEEAEQAFRAIMQAQ